MLIEKANVFIDIIQSERKDAAARERKTSTWDRIATYVNEVNTTGSIRSGKDASNKWQQLKCKAGGDLKKLKEQFKIGFEM